jgi:hypothetical protein
MLHQNGPETKLIEQLRSGWILGAKTHELTIATELVDRPALSGFLHNTTASAHLVNLIKGEEPAERQRTMTLLEGFASTGHLDSFVLSIEGTDQLEAFKRVLASPDSPAYKELHELIKIPYFAEMVAEQGDNLYTVNSLHDRRLLLDSEPDSPYAAMRSELIELSRVSGLDKMEDSVLAKEMIRLYFNDVSAMGRRSDSDAQFEQYLAQARTVSEVLLFPDIQEVFSALSGRNPELARVVAGELLHGDNTDIIARVVALHGLAELPPQSFTQNELRAITRAAPNIEPFEGIALYSKLGLAEVTGPKGMLTSQADKVLAWALGSEGGSVDQKRALLMSEQARQFYMIANKKGHRMYATGFAGQLDQGRTTDEITRYMTECVETSRDVELDRVILEASSGAYLPDVIWRVILQSDSPRAAANTLSTGLLANRGPLLRELAKYDQAIIEGMVEGYIRSEDALQYAQEWQAVLTDTHVLELVGSQSLQYALRQQILTPMLQSPHPLAIATHFERQLVQQRPLWYANYETSRTLIDGDKMFVEDMVVGELPVGLPAINRQLSAGEVEALLDGTLLRPIAEMSVEEKKFYIGDSVTGDLDNLETVRMSELDSDTRQNILIYRMFETVERSRSEPIRMRASQRNMAQVFAGEPLWQEGDLVHFTDMLNMQSLLLSGNLASEVVGGTIANRDTYPFNVDFWRVENDLLSLPSNEERFNALSLAYGDVALHYRRGPGAYRAGEEFGSGNSRFANPHYLMFAGMPSTEVSAMTVRTQSALEPLRKMLIETGIYVPLYTPDGTLQFTPEEFITRYNDGNYAAVQPETVDSVFVVRDTKKGSNEGAEVYIPSADGQPIKWYAKFVDNSLEHSSEHIWTEFLGDGIYQEVHPELVPESRVVRIGGRLARISRMVEPGGRVTNAGRNAGFVLDCLLANWDAVYNGEDNLVASATSVDTALRVDNGGALDFSGGGARKNQLFGDEVLELGVGSDDRVLGGGMRQKYPDLTDKDIRVQAQELSERLTDDAIDRRVDRVRRSSADRAMLKRTLKARRDYIVAYAAEL